MREAAVALLPSAGALPEGWLRGRLTAGRPRPVRGAAFRLLISRGGVVRLRAAVGLLDDPDDKLRQWAGQTVQRAGTQRCASCWAGRSTCSATHVLKRRKGEAGLRA
ncbi:hypothetical protein ACFWHW_36675 [Streptomyces pharetrae]|uniref:hypothetical protein n=1 Tax=Streptomyces pharetrae TaxID=291370 RepID=UPI003652B6B6